MAVSSFSLQTKAGYNNNTVPMHLNSSPVGSHLFFPKRFICPTKRVPHQRVRRYQAFCSLDVAVPNIDIPLSASINSTELMYVVFSFFHLIFFVIITPSILRNCTT
ncbi:hypothetical protein Hdeb2414_s0005g00182421 [Helianthus debilis subsp. tardiflorus]